MCTTVWNEDWCLLLQVDIGHCQTSNYEAAKCGALSDQESQVSDTFCIVHSYDEHQIGFYYGISVASDNTVDFGSFQTIQSPFTQFDARNYSREMLAVRLLDATLMEALKVI